MRSHGKRAATLGILGVPHGRVTTGTRGLDTPVGRLLTAGAPDPRRVAVIQIQAHMSPRQGGRAEILERPARRGRDPPPIDLAATWCFVRHAHVLGQGGREPGDPLASLRKQSSGRRCGVLPLDAVKEQAFQSGRQPEDDHCGRDVPDVHDLPSRGGPDPPETRKVPRAVTRISGRRPPGVVVPLDVDGRRRDPTHMLAELDAANVDVRGGDAMAGVERGPGRRCGGRRSRQRTHPPSTHVEPTAWDSDVAAQGLDAVEGRLGLGGGTGFGESGGGETSTVQHPAGGPVPGMGSRASSTAARYSRRKAGRSAAGSRSWSACGSRGSGTSWNGRVLMVPLWRRASRCAGWPVMFGLGTGCQVGDLVDASPGAPADGTP